MKRWFDGIVILGLAIYAAPFGWQLFTSLRPDAELLGPGWWTGRLTLAHYRNVRGESLLRRALWNSAACSGSSPAASKSNAVEERRRFPAALRALGAWGPCRGPHSDRISAQWR